jgi:hypothetical protein
MDKSAGKNKYIPLFKDISKIIYSHNNGPYLNLSE